MKIWGIFNASHWIGDILYTCDVESSPITKPGTKVTSSEGVHHAGKNNVDVEAINFFTPFVEYLPIGLKKIFPNLILLQANNCGLKEISRHDLIGLENLTTLWLTNNQLQSLPDDLLSGMAKLTRVSFENNKLEFVSAKLLQPIMDNKLISVDFTSNPTKIGFYAPGTLGSLGSLQELCDVIDENCKKPMGTRRGLSAEDKTSNTYEVLIDNEQVESRSLKDPEAQKTEDWDERATLADPDDKKTEDWDKAVHIPDPDATKPDDWDGKMDGDWEAPQIDNPEYSADDNLYLREEICPAGLELWQVKSGTISDNVLFTVDPEYAKTAAATSKATQKGEKKQKDAQDEEERKKTEAESKTEEKDEDNEDLDDEEGTPGEATEETCDHDEL